MPLTARAGFTIIELLIAIVMVAIGVLGAVATSAVIVREQDDGRSAMLAAAVAVNRLEWLRSHPCTQEAGHALGAKGMSESWTSTPATSGLRSVADSIHFAVAGTPRTFTLRAQVWC